MSRRAGVEGHDEISSFSALPSPIPVDGCDVCTDGRRRGILSPMSNVQALDVDRV